MNNKMMKIDKQYLKQGMELAVDIHDMKGNVLVAAQTVLKDYQIKNIHNISNVKYVYVNLPKNTKKDVASQEVVSDYVITTSKDDVKKVSVEIIRTSVINKVKQNLSHFSDKSDSNFKILFDIVEQIVASVLSSDGLVYEINRIQSSNDYLYNHSINTAILSLLIGISAGFKTNDLYSLARGGFFSDIGKLQIDPIIIYKPGELTVEEYDIVKKYPEYGYSFMKQFTEMDEVALDCILHSREKIDGTGYPNGLKQAEISLHAQIVSLASYFDALCSDKTYRKAVSPYKAMTMAFNEEDTHFVAKVLKKAIKILGYYDVGMFLELKSTDIVKVIKRGRYKPVVKIIQAPVIDNSKHIYEIDMAKNPSVTIKDVLVKSEYDKLISNNKV